MRPNNRVTVKWFTCHRNFYAQWYYAKYNVYVNSTVYRVIPISQTDNSLTKNVYIFIICVPEIYIINIKHIKLSPCNLYIIYSFVHIILVNLIILSTVLNFSFFVIIIFLLLIMRYESLRHQSKPNPEHNATRLGYVW